MSKAIVGICTHSVIPSFVVGESYEIARRYSSWISHKVGRYIALPDGEDAFKVCGKGGVILATFNTAEAKETERKRKSHRKMLVRAFKKIGKGWCDSKKTPYGFRRGGCAGLGDWARAWADAYVDDNGNILPYHADYFVDGIGNIDQAAIDYFVEEELSYL